MSLEEAWDELHAATPPGQQVATAVAQAEALFAHEDGRTPTHVGVSSRQVQAWLDVDVVFAAAWQRASMRRGYLSLLRGVFGEYGSWRAWESREWFRTGFWLALEKELRQIAQRERAAEASQRSRDMARNQLLELAGVDADDDERNRILALNDWDVAHELDRRLGIDDDDDLPSLEDEDEDEDVVSP